jgi:hypothetical protein
VFKGFKSTVMAVLFIRAISFAGLDTRSMEATSLFYGPAACAVNENTVSVLMNPAGLYHILNTELLLNFDRSYAFNYAAAGHFFHGFGNLALAGFNDAASKRQITALGWGGRIAGTEKGPFQHLLILGFNAQAIFISSDVFFSMNPGLLYLLRSSGKGFRNLSIGISSSGLFDHSSTFSWQTGISLSFRIMRQRDLLLAFGTEFDTPLRLKNWGAGLEMEILQPVYFGLGGGNDVLSMALNLKWINDVLYFSGTYDIVTKAVKGAITYRRIVAGSPFTELPGKKQNTVKSGESRTRPQKPPKITEEMLERQKDLLQEGVRLYTDNEFYPAIEKWKQVLEISPETEYGKQAAGYIDICEVELKGLKSK